MLTFEGSPDRQVSQREAMPDQEGPQGQGLVQLCQRRCATGWISEAASAELQPVVNLQTQLKFQLTHSAAEGWKGRVCSTHLGLLHYVGSIEAESGSHPGQVPADGVVISELD